MYEYLNELNEAQRDAVENYSGASLVIAGAGSGKTRVLTYRIAHLLNSGVKPYTILALTFTNKAANSMKERIKSLIGSDQSNSLWMGTFHSVFAKILRMEAAIIGYTPKYTIYDTTDSRSLIKSIVKEMNLDHEVYKPAEIHSRISGAKNNLIMPESYSSNKQIAEFDRATKKPEIGDIYKAYAARCRKADAMDFDDILVNMNILIRDFPEILEKYQKKFNYILVDEYQDTNYSQYLIIKKLSLLHGNVCVVGDDAQSIYSFRGAKIENILNFKNDYPDYNLFKLEQNYRSTKNIVLAANSLIAINEGQIPKQLFSENEIGEKIKVLKNYTDTEESYQVAGSIVDSVYINKYMYSDYAILYRTNAQSRGFEEALRRRNIPYKIYGGISFYQRKEIKDVLSYFRLVVNPKDEEALRRIINYPARGIGDTTLEKLIFYSNEQGLSIWDIITDIGSHQLPLNAGAINKLKQFASLIQSLATDLSEKHAYEISTRILAESGLMNEFKNDHSTEGISRMENIEALLSGISEFIETETEDGELPTLDKFMQNIFLLTDQDDEKPEDKNKVTLMTVHAAKGLEFKSVYIVGVEENLFPSSMSMNNAKQIEEERRLFYVAITRAEKYATISYAQSRYKWGSLTSTAPSRFIKEIDKEFLDMPIDDDIDDDIDEDDEPFENSKQSFFKPKLIPQKNKPQVPAFATNKKLLNMNKAHQQTAPVEDSFESDDASLVQVGMNVSHQRFGIGKIIHLEGIFPNTKATVFFHEAGQKQLLLKFAKLKILE